MSTVTQQIFEITWQEMVSISDVSFDDLESLFCLFGEQHLDMLPSLSYGQVKRILGPSWRYLFRVYNVKSTKKVSKYDKYDYNHVLPVGNLCDCTKWEDEGCENGQFEWCTHILAAKISASLGGYETIRVTEEEFQDIINQIINV